LVGLGVFGRSKPKRFRKGFWQMIHRGGASKGFWRLGVFVGVFGVFGGVFGLKCGKNDILGS